MLLASWLSGWSGRARMLRSDCPATRRRRRRRENVLAWVETLETRQLLTVNVFFNSVEATLHINTDNADPIAISSDESSTVFVNGNPVMNSGQSLLATDPNLTHLDILATGNFANVVNLSLVTIGAFTSLTSVTVSAGDGPDTITGSEFGDRLLGGNGDDNYLFGGAFGADTVSDSLGNDALNLQSVSGDLVADLTSQSITTGSNSVAFSVTDIDKINSGSGNDTFRGRNAPGQWQLNTIGRYVSGPANLMFSGFEILQGGTNSDQFLINQTSTLTLKGGAGDDSFELLDGVQAGTLDGEGGSDLLSYATFTTPVIVNLSQLAATNVTSLSQVENVAGGMGGDMLIGDSNKNLLDGRVGNDTLNGGGGFDFLRGGDDDDLLTNGIDSDGQIGNDLIVIDTPLNTHSVDNISLVAETIQIGADLKTDGGMINLTGNVLLTASVLLDTETGNNSAPGSVKFSGGTIRTQSSSNDLTIDTSTKGSAPAGPVTLTTFDNGGGSAPKIHDLIVNATSGLGSNANLNLGAGIDVSNGVFIDAGSIIVDRPVTAGGDITLASHGPVGDLTVKMDSFGGNLSVRSIGGNLMLFADRTVAIHEDIGTGGSGTITLTAGRNIVLDTAAQLLTDNGGIQLMANQATPSASGNFAGIRIDGAAISSNTGDVLLQAHGGDTGDFNSGVLIKNSATLTGGGAVTVTGLAHGDGSSNVGVRLESSGTITSSGGDVHVTGTGSGSSVAGSSNNGVRISNGGTITASGMGQVIVEGMGGSGTGGLNEGVHVENSGSSITSGGGNVFVTGLEGLNGSGLAISLTNSGSISTVSNGGDATVSGNSMAIASSASISANTSGTVTLRPQVFGLGIDLGATSDPFGGPLSLSDAELDQVTAGLIRIGDESSGPIVVTDTIDRSTPTNFALTAGGSNDIAFNGPNAILNSGNGNVRLSLNPDGTGAITSGGALKDIVAINVGLASGDRGIGAISNPLITDASTLTAMTQGDAPMFLSEFDSITLTTTGLSSGDGDINLSSGLFRLSGSDQVDDASVLVIKSGAVFMLNGFDETLGGLSGGGSVINGSATAATLSLNLASNGVFGGVLGGSGTAENNFGLSKFGSGTLTLSGTNTYTGDTVVTGGTLLINGSITSDVADALPLASILPTRVSVVEGDSGLNFITFLVKLNKPSDKTITIEFSTRLGGDPTFKRPERIGSDTPFATDQPGPWDFFRSSGQLTFDPGVTEQPLRVQIRPDDTPEANELFFVQLQSPVNVKLAPQQSVAIAQILDDDSVPQLIIANTQVLEGDSDGQNEMVFTVRLIGDLPLGTASVTADYSIGNIAIDTATAGDDYGIAFESKLNGEMPTFTNQLTFTNALRTREVHVPIMGDTANEADKTLSLRLQNHDDPATIGLSRRKVVGTIINDDSTTNVLVAISPAVFKIRENNSGSQQVEFIVTLIGKPSGTVSVNYATVDATATAGSDYEAANGTLDFTLADILAGIAQKSVFATVFGDTAIEPDETFTVALSLPPGTRPEVSINSDLAAGKVVIRNDDQAILTEDGDALALALSNDLTAILGAGAKNNSALIAALRARAVQIIQSQGLTKAIVIIIDPVDFVLTDPGGRQSGYTETAGSVNQIPGTYYSGDGAVELLIVPLPANGTYNVQLAGLGGDFNASITVVDSNGTTINIVSQNLSDGETSSVSFQVDNTSTTIPVGLGLAAANASASAIGVVGAFGQFGFRFALAPALEEAASDGFDVDGPDSLPTGLMFWLSVSARVARQQFIEPLWQSLGTPLGNLLGEGELTRIVIPSEFVDQFWSLVGQTLTGVPSGIYRLGNMLESVIPTLVPRRNRLTTPRAGDQGQPNTPPGNNGVKSKRSSLERPRATPTTPPSGGQTPRPVKPNATKDKSAQTPESKKADNQQSSSHGTHWLWFPFNDEKSAAVPAHRRGA